MFVNQIWTDVTQKTEVLNQLTVGKTVEINHQTIEIPVIAGLSCDLTETWMLSILEQLFQEQEGVFLDVGINLGQTLIKVKGIDLERKYIGFEPNPTCVFYVKELIKENQFKDCTIFPVGLFTEDTVLLLECIGDTEVDSAASLIQNFRPDHIIQRRIPVPVFRFQTIANMLDLDKVGIVKIDVEGAELEVVKSLHQLLDTQRPIVLLEVLPVYSNENMMRKERQEELEQIFNELKYCLFRVDKSNDAFVGLKRKYIMPMRYGIEISPPSMPPRIRITVTGRTTK